MKLSHVFAVFALLLTGMSCAVAAGFTPAEVLDYQRMGDLHVSPDGKKLAFIILSYPLDYKPRIRILDVATGAANEITPAGKSERSPQWSPDGKALAFLSNRDGRTQVYLMPAAGGTATTLTAAKNGV